MHQFFQNQPKIRPESPSFCARNIQFLPKKKTLSFHCITLILFCQVFMLIFAPFSDVFALEAPENSEPPKNSNITQFAEIVQNSPLATTNSTSELAYTPSIGVNNFYFKNFEADYYLSKALDGTSRLLVTEKLTAVFPKNSQSHGITRAIPFTNQDGKNLTMLRDDLLEIDVLHNGQDERPHKVEAGDGFFKVYLGDADSYVTGEHTYELTYEFRNIITEFSDDGRSWQELYWDTNGNDWSQRFNELTARIHFAEPEIAENFTGQSWCYVGKYGDSGQDRCETRLLDDGIEFHTEKLLPGENLTFDLEFTDDTFVIPAPKVDYRLVIAFILELAAIGFSIVICILKFRKISAKRKFYRDYFIKPEYTPPHGLSVAEAAANYLHSGRLGSSKVATLLELAIQHKIEIIKVEKPSKLKRAKYSWRVRLKTLNLNREQLIILQILAGSKSSLSLNQEITIKSHSATSELLKLDQDFTTIVEGNLLKNGLTEPSKSKRPKIKHRSILKRYTTSMIAWILILIMFVFAVPMLFEDSPSYIHVIGSGILESIMILIFFIWVFCLMLFAARYNVYQTHTMKGLEYSRYLDGLKKYMQLAEQERLAFLQSVDGVDTTHTGIVRLYEKLLPYAVLFKLEKSWLAELSKYYEFDDVAGPVWYIGPGVFSASDFAASMVVASNLISTSTTHSTTSNSSSGFSGGGGGGFSGGGGGGGGGGGW